MNAVHSYGVVVYSIMTFLTCAGFATATMFSGLSVLVLFMGH